MKSLMVLSFLLLFVVNPCQARSKGKKNQDQSRVAPQAKRAMVKKMKPDPSHPAALLDSMKSRWEVLKLVRRHLTPEQFKDMRALADRFKVDLRKKMDIGFSKEGSFALPEHKLVFKVGKDGRSLVVNGKSFRWDKKTDVKALFRSVEESLKPKKSAGLLELFLFPAAEAKVRAEESAGYDMMMALAAQDFYMAGDDTLMYDLMAKNDRLVSIAARLNEGDRTFQFRCREDGMDLKFSDGTTSEYSFTGEGETFKSNLTETNEEWMFTHNVSGANPGMTNSAYFYVCQKALHDSGLVMNEWSPATPTSHILGNPAEWQNGSAADASR